MAVTVSDTDLNRILGASLFNVEQRKAIKGIVELITAAADTELASGALEVEVDNLNAWATALATKLNADAGVTDVNYDTDPQA